MRHRGKECPFRRGPERTSIGGWCRTSGPGVWLSGGFSAQWLSHDDRPQIPESSKNRVQVKLFGGNQVVNWLRMPKRAMTPMTLVLISGSRVRLWALDIGGHVRRSMGILEK